MNSCLSLSQRSVPVISQKPPIVEAGPEAADRLPSSACDNRSRRPDVPLSRGLWSVVCGPHVIRPLPSAALCDLLSAISHLRTADRGPWSLARSQWSVVSLSLIHI